MSAKRKLPSKLGQPKVKQSAKIAGKGNPNESRAVITGGGAAIGRGTNGLKEEIVSISSDSSSNEGEDEDTDAERGDLDVDERGEKSEDEADTGDVSMRDTSVNEDPAGVADVEGEPSFGDLVRANASEPVDVAAAFADPTHQEIIFPTQIQPPSGASLGTVLAQALKTNDVPLLESCLHTTDVNTIRATIQRLESPLAGKLLQKLAERLHRRPGRAGSLMVWVQWTLVTHGGYLATQRDLIKQLEGLDRVIEERAKGLQSLLSLKGKLDMLEAQIELRRSMQNQRRRHDADEHDDDVVYIESQEESDDEEEAIRSQALLSNGNLVDISEDESGLSEDESANDLLDNEAEETDLDTGDEDEVDHEDLDSQGDEDVSDDGGAHPPPKVQRVGGTFSKRR